MQTPSTTLLWMEEQVGPLAVMALIGAVILTILYVSARNRTIKLNAERADINEDTFVSDLLAYGFNPFLARATYQYLQQRQHIAFPIRPTDLLDEDLGLDIESLDQTVVELLEATGRLLRPGLRLEPLVTVEDLVRFIQASPRLSEIAAA